MAVFEQDSMPNVTAKNCILHAFQKHCIYIDSHLLQLLQVADAVIRVAEVAIQTRLHAESCHPCFKVSVVDISSSDRLCSVPGVVVDSSIAAVGPDGGVRIPAEFEDFDN